MCADFGPLGIQVNGLGPGYFATELTAALVADPSSPRGWNGVQPRAAAVASKSSVERSCSSQARVQLRQRPHRVRRRCHDGRRPIRNAPPR